VPTEALETPTLDKIHQIAEQLATMLKDKLGTACMFLEKIVEVGTSLCTQLGGAIAESPPIPNVPVPPQAIAVVVEEVCVGFLTASKVACKLDKVFDVISTVTDYVKPFTAAIEIRPLVVSPMFGAKLGDEVQVNPGDPIPNFTVELGSMGQAKITSLTVDPSSPAADQSYVATAEIQCLAPDTPVTITVVGTDGYTDSNTQNLSNDSFITLTVPGGAQGVRDVVKVNVQGGPTRQLSLVFS
jgi:hypothetical protein